VNPALTRSNVSIARTTIRLIPTNILSGDIVSTKSSIPRNILNSGKPERTQLIQLQMPVKYDFERFKGFFTKHPEK